MSRKVVQFPALEALCKIADSAGWHVELHVTGPPTSSHTHARRLDRIRVSKDRGTLAHASIRRGGLDQAARICIEELAKRDASSTP